MNYFLFVTSLTGFFMLSPLVAIVRMSRREWMPIWLALVIAAAGGWILSNAAVYFYFEHLDDMMASYVNPPQELVDEWTADGAKFVFARYFGWLYGLISAAPWFIAAELLSVHFEGARLPPKPRCTRRRIISNIQG